MLEFKFIFTLLLIAVVQLGLVPLGFPGVVETPGLHLNMYTAIGFVPVVVGIFQIILLSFFFKDYSSPMHNVSANEAKLRKLSPECDSATEVEEGSPSSGTISPSLGGASVTRPLGGASVAGEVASLAGAPDKEPVVLVSVTQLTDSKRGE